MVKLDNLILSQTTRNYLEKYLRQPTHALLLAGPVGVGLGTIAKSIGKELASNQVVTIEPQIHTKQKQSSINIDDIHGLAQLTRSRRRDRTVIILDDVSEMTDNAPQAFLKLLEEPIPNIHYILTTHQPDYLPVTILSRVQLIQVIPPTLTDFEHAPDSLTAEIIKDRQAQISFLSARLPAEMSRLVNDDEYYKKQATVAEQAKNFVQGNEYQRLKVASQVKDRGEASDLVLMIGRLLMHAALKSPENNGLAEQLEVVSTVIDNLHHNGNVRMQLCYLALSL